MAIAKKNQHYIPKFYLRNFSFKCNRKEIGVYNIINELFIKRGKLKTQGSKNFFYGYNGEIEENLSEIESELSRNIQQILSLKIVPKKNTNLHLELLTFIALTDVRNPVRVEETKSMLTGMKNRLKELNDNVNPDDLVPNPTHEEIIKLLLSLTPQIILIIKDLNYKLLINKTNNPFITSDYPVVKYNQFLEEKKWPQSKAGYGTVGLQIFIPLNPEILIFFFDSGIYKLGEKRKEIFEIKNPKEINSINILQFINCFETIYFNENVSKEYIRMLHQQAKKYKRANIPRTELSYIIKGNEDKDKVLAGPKNLMVFGSSDCECKLTLSGLKIHSLGRAYRFNNSVAQLRPQVKRNTNM